MQNTASNSVQPQHCVRDGEMWRSHVEREAKIGLKGHRLVVMGNFFKQNNSEEICNWEYYSE